MDGKYSRLCEAKSAVNRELTHSTGQAGAVFSIVAVYYYRSIVVSLLLSVYQVLTKQTEFCLWLCQQSPVGNKLIAAAAITVVLIGDC